MSRFSDSCEHVHRVHDTHTATEICDDCALVLDMNTNLCYYRKSCSDVKQKKKKSDTSALHTMIVEACERINLPVSFVPLIIKHYVNINETKRRVQMETVACSIYNVCKQEDVMRTLAEVQAVTGCSPKRLWKLERRVGTSNNVNCIALIEKYSQYLELTLKQMLFVLTNTQKKVVLCSSKPCTIIAAYVRICTKLPLKKITSIIPVSAKSVHKFIAQHVRT